MTCPVARNLAISGLAFNDLLAQPIVLQTLQSVQMSDRKRTAAPSVDLEIPSNDNTDLSPQSLVRQVYNELLRPHLPRKLGLYNGVIARQPRLFDATDHIPNYKDTFLTHVRDAVDAGETVVVIGGGKGIASVVAAEAVGNSGRVITYEASRSQAEICRETMALNEVSDVSTVEVSLVGPAKNVYGADTAAPLAVDELPEHDALVMDCEGAEKEIITALSEVDGRTMADSIVVETHSQFGAPLKTIVDCLSMAGYEVERTDEATWAETDHTDCVCTARKVRDEKTKKPASNLRE